MPTSVLLAVLAAASLLALAPALVRRYDATERLAAERTTSTARVLARRRSRRTVPGRVPINPPRPVPWSAEDDHGVVAFHGGTVGVHESLNARDGAAGGSRNGGSREAAGGGRRRSTTGPRRHAGAATRRRSAAGSTTRVGGRSKRRRAPASAMHRRRRVFAALELLNLVEVVGIVLVGPGMWISFAVTAGALTAYVVHLRNRSIAAARRRRQEARRARWVAAQQAAVRREHERRAAQRREAQRRLVVEREAARREAMRRATEYVERYSRLDRAVGDAGEPPMARPARPGVQPNERPGPVRGRPYEHPGH
ncbi:hypothetical protein GCM10009682_16820 [Luedemannella flava]|uniref:Integral membrane protein n=1 Tax=Luedemannella flava TaxID=349316 RepID=A0ABN2LR12_9ACTN